MDSIYPPQATSGLPEYQAINTVLFIVWIVVALLALVTTFKFSKHVPGRHTEPFRAKFIELEKDFRWRRLKIAYLVASIVIILIVIGISYGTGTRAPLQTLYDFEVERAKARMGTTFAAIVTTLVIWGGFFIALPVIYRYVAKAKDYLRNPEKAGRD